MPRRDRLRVGVFAVTPDHCWVALGADGLGRFVTEFPRGEPIRLLPAGVFGVPNQVAIAATVVARNAPGQDLIGAVLRRAEFNRTT